uniref:Uncharacterized protein n=1 Tax=uncultured Thiotrichaceae bacterium TaxID=298394 RepID=A0A6S6UC44_9GAMM|nr:MAG: Unknown protein [uncultured Thiotrichaceae bacterium]
MDALVASNGNNFVFLSPNANHIYVHPERVLGYQLNYLSSLIGHEFIHAKDHATNKLQLGDSKSIARSEVRAYGWQVDTASEFQLSNSQIDFLKTNHAYFKQLAK